MAKIKKQASSRWRNSKRYHLQVFYLKLLSWHREFSVELSSIGCYNYYKKYTDAVFSIRRLRNCFSCNCVHYIWNKKMGQSFWISFTYCIIHIFDSANFLLLFLISTVCGGGLQLTCFVLDNFTAQTIVAFRKKNLAHSVFLQYSVGYFFLRFFKIFAFSRTITIPRSEHLPRFFVCRSQPSLLWFNRIRTCFLDD